MGNDRENPDGDISTAATAAVQRAARGALIRWGIRTVLGAVIFGAVAMKVPWGKWLLLLWLPLAIGSLVALLSYRRQALDRAENQGSGPSQ